MRFRRTTQYAAILLALACAGTGSAQSLAPLRPPAVPLIAHDPYWSVWSMADHLTDRGTAHWTGKPNSLAALVRVDGKTYQAMGHERQAAAALEQVRLEVWPTRTVYEFAGAGVKVGLTFFTPALPRTWRFSPGPSRTSNGRWPPRMATRMKPRFTWRPPRTWW